MREFLAEYGDLLLSGTLKTLAMALIGTCAAYVLGIPLGVLATATAPGSLRPHRGFNMVLGWIINIGRSIPFIILLVALIPFTRLLMGTSIGTTGAIVPLVVAATPFVARMVESSLQEVGGGVVEAALSYGASTGQIITKVMLKEGLPLIIRGASITLITLIGYSAMAGAIGAGGLGDIAVRYGYYRYQDNVMFATIIILIVLVQGIQSAGDLLARVVDKRNR
ncbi:MAG: ABC transporter permease [Coriobacteriia bacterium]|nr:ABC transporter permease [Coriobacteriia bacterium]